MTSLSDSADVLRSIEDSLSRLMNWAETKNYRGYDIYDGLGMVRSDRLLRNRAVNTLVTQFFKKAPINLRPLLGINESIMPKGMGLFLNAYILLSASYGSGIKEDDVNSIRYKNAVEYLKDWLLRHSLKEYSGTCWNFGFNYKLMLDQPTIVITAIISRALFAYYLLYPDEKIKEELRSVCNFILNDLPISEDPYGVCFSYTPAKRDCCYNANMLGAEILAKVYSITKAGKLLECSRKAVDFTIAHQHDDGHWNYSIDLQTGKERKQIDFHQGYILDSLYDCIHYAGMKDSCYLDALMAGAEFYRNNQFLQDGRSKWRLPKSWPVDIHNQAQGIITFGRLGALKNEYLELAIKIALWTIEHMQDKEGYFYYQKHRYFTNRIPYMRWAQAWMMLALASLIEKVK